MTKIICAALLLAATASPVRATDVFDSERWLQEAEVAYARVTSYTAVFHKQQRVVGTLLPEETILIKFKKPFSLYMSWIKPPYKGGELLYVQGWNDNQIRAHRGGILRFITRNLDLKEPMLMHDNLRPVTSLGIGYLLATVAMNVRKATKAGELNVTERGEETLYGRKTQVVELRFPKERAKDYDGHRFVVNQDVESKMLVRIRIYDRDDQLVEYYAYENLDLGARLTDAAFDPHNPEYHF